MGLAMAQWKRHSNAVLTADQFLLETIRVVDMAMETDPRRPLSGNFGGDAERPVVAERRLSSTTACDPTRRSVFSEADGQRINLMSNCPELRRPRTPRNDPSLNLLVDA